MNIKKALFKFFIDTLRQAVSLLLIALVLGVFGQQPEEFENKVANVPRKIVAALKQVGFYIPLPTLKLAMTNMSTSSDVIFKTESNSVLFANLPTNAFLPTNFNSANLANINFSDQGIIVFDYSNNVLDRDNLLGSINFANANLLDQETFSYSNFINDNYMLKPDSIFFNTAFSTDFLKQNASFPFCIACPKFENVTEFDFEALTL